jgi:hypothetical protein
MRRTVAGLAVSVLVLTAGAGAAAQAPPPAAPPAPPSPAPERIAPGVSVGGVDLGGLTVPEATMILREELRPRLASKVTVRLAGRRHTLRTRAVRMRFHARRTARRALKAGKRSQAPVGVLPATSLSRGALRAFVRGLAARVDVAPRNATLQITLTRMIRRRSFGGRRLNQNELEGRLLRTLRNPLKPRSLEGRRRRVPAPVTYAGLERRYPTIVTIDRAGYRLRLFKRLRYERSYGIAVGAAGFDTPSGLFSITSKQVNPAWHAPDRPWAGSYAGRTIPGGAPDNPLKARWLGVTGAVGIHGTGEPWSIGSRASHGCIRMRVPDVVDLYPRVPLGAPVLIR